MKKLIYFLCTMYYVLCTSNPAKAVTEFSTDFRSTYEISSRGVAKVTHDIKITNNLAHIYTTEYAIQVGSNHIDDVQAVSSGKSLPVKLDNNGNSTMIKIAIVNPSIGQGATTSIVLSYTTTDIAENIGSNWEINIPRLAKANEATFYSRKLIIPKSMGEPNIVTPNATTMSEEGDSRIYEFVGYTRDSISLLFGKVGNYKLDLIYHIKNPSLATSDTEIALPPDTEYQRVIIGSLSPTPKEIRLDKDGNWLAIYNLKSQETSTINATVYATVSPTPIYDITLPVSNLLTKSSKYWPTNNQSVIDLGSKLKGSAEIYSYIVENFTYDFRRVGKKERLGAAKALENPSSAICTEYTDSFVALARHLNIPAREINGYAYTENLSLKPTGSEDVLHAWPSYYDSESKTWLQIDPTWGSTTGGVDYFSKLDFSHIAFVIHGVEDNYPIPAGAYKDNENDKTIQVSLEDNVPVAEPVYALSKSGGELVVTATGNAALHNVDISDNGHSYHIDYLPPYGKQMFNLLPEKTTFFTRLLTFLKSVLN